MRRPIAPCAALTALLLGACGARSPLVQGDDEDPLAGIAPPTEELTETVAGDLNPPTAVTTTEPAPRAPPRSRSPELPADVVERPAMGMPPVVDVPVPPEPLEPDPDPELPVPEECRLAPVMPDLQEEAFEVLADEVTEDFAPPEGERWNWAADDAPDPDWPYPSRAVWPAPVSLPMEAEEDFEFVAIAGSGEDDVYVVGRRGSAALALHLEEGTWSNESAGLLAALPSATVVNSVSVVAPDRVWATTPEGLLRFDGATWEVVDVPAALYPLGAVWVSAEGFGVLVGGTVATTQDGGERWQLETRGLGFVAPGMAYSRSFVRVAGHGNDATVVGRFGHLLTRNDEGWTASTLLASDAAFTAEGQFVTTRSPSQGLFFRERPELWQLYPLSLDSDALDRVWASPDGDVFAGGSVWGVLHRFPDGSVELLPSEVSNLRDFYGSPSWLYALAPTSLWRYDLGEVRSSGVARASAVDAALLDLAPTPATAWGESAASNFEPLACVDDVLRVAGAPVWQGELAPEPPRARYGSCAGGTERQFSETAFSFEAPTTGTYRIVLSEASTDAGQSGTLRLALRNGCEGWVIWGGGRGPNSRAVDIGLEAGQLLLIEVYATDAVEVPVPFELSIY